MENISLEQIELVMQRAKCSYTEAKEALEHCNGDVVESLLYLEKLGRIKKDSSFSQKTLSYINKLNAIDFIMEKNGHTYVNVPLSIALVCIICTFHLSIVAIIILILIGVRIHVEGENELSKKINSTLDKVKK